MENSDTSFPPMGNKVRALARIRGINMQDLADKIGMTHGGLIQIVDGDNPKAKTILKIADGLNIEPGWFWMSDEEFMEAISDE